MPVVMGKLPNTLAEHRRSDRIEWCGEAVLRAIGLTEADDRAIQTIENNKEELKVQKLRTKILF